MTERVAKSYKKNTRNEGADSAGDETRDGNQAKVQQVDKDEK